MPKPRTLIAVRTHRADTASLDLYEQLRTLPDAHTIFCVDERNGIADMAGREKIAFDRATLEELGLYAHPNSGWLCGDYCHIVTRHHRPDYDTYWLIEPDVLIHTANLAAFFAQFVADPADLLASGLRAAEPNWFWTKTILPLGIPPYRCFFPVTRLSARAIDCLATTRRRLSSDPAIATLSTWPNDEALTASTLMHAGFSCTDLNASGRACYTQQSFRFADFIDRDVVAATPSDELLYHPARNFDAWFTGATATVLKLARSRAKEPDTIRHHAVTLERIARSCAENREHAGASLAPLLLARRFRSQLAIEASASNSRTADKRLCEMFGVQPGKPALATAYLLEGESGSTVRADQAFPLGTIPTSEVLPSAIDFTRQEVTLTLHMTVAPLLASPNIAQQQLLTACAAIRIKIADLPAALGPPGDHADATIMFSLDTTRSTALDRPLQAYIGKHTILPPALQQLCEHYTAFCACSPAERHALVQAAIMPLLKAAAGACAIQMLPGADCLAADIAATFPDARYTVLCQHLQEWARNTLRTGAPFPAHAAALRLEQLAALRQLQHTCPQLTIIRTADRSVNAARSVGQTVEHSAEHEINHIEQDWIDRFESEWAKCRPQNLPEALDGLF